MEPILPVIRLQDAWLLREHVSKRLHELRAEDAELPDDEWMARRVGEYRKAWQPHEQKILRYMTESLGLSFRQNIIDVYVVPYLNAFSDPLVIGTTCEPHFFVDTLTHELLHRLLTDNTSIPFEMRLRVEWERLFGKRPYGELVHIAVDAVHKAIYLDVLDLPEQLERNIAFSKKGDGADYIHAWEYVNKHGYKDIIKQLRESYEKLAS